MTPEEADAGKAAAEKAAAEKAAAEKELAEVARKLPEFFTSWIAAEAEEKVLKSLKLKIWVAFGIVIAAAVLGVPFTARSMLKEATSEEQDKLTTAKAELKAKVTLIDELADQTRARAKDAESASAKANETSAKANETLAKLQPQLADVERQLADVE